MSFFCVLFFDAHVIFICLALQELEKVRAKAQYALEDAEEDLDEAYGKVNDSLREFLASTT